MEEEKNEGRAFRWAIGFIVMSAAIGGFAALFILRVPPENKDAMMFALGSVFGWAAAVVASEYGATSIGRKVAEGAVRGLERQNIANEVLPVGTTDHPAQVEVVNTVDKPANVKVEGEEK
jgi:hypothetical protein